MTSGTSATSFDLYSVEIEAAPIPEPATLGLLGLGAAMLVRRNRSSH